MPPTLRAVRFEEGFYTQARALVTDPAQLQILLHNAEFFIQRRPDRGKPVGDGYWFFVIFIQGTPRNFSVFYSYDEYRVRLFGIIERPRDYRFLIL